MASVGPLEQPRCCGRRGSRPPKSDRSGEPRQLRDPDTIAPVGAGVPAPCGHRRCRRRRRRRAAAPCPARRPPPHRSGHREQAQPAAALVPAGQLLLSGQQQLADAVPRIWLAAPVAEGGLLGPPADLVDHRVGQLDGVEVVHDHGRVAKWDDQRAGVPAPGVQRDRADAGQPVMGPSTKPAGHRGPGAVGHHLQQPATLQVDQAGDLPGRRSAGGLRGSWSRPTRAW
jgi:hypothetical protein